MKSVEGLFPWIIIGLGVLLFTFGFWGVLGGLIMIASAINFLYKNDRKSETRFFFIVLKVLTVLFIVVMFLFVTLSFS
ncbi:hypothetical protein RH915_05235 [Serpentinicella sp. ANB-PHB4]|uniref:hypothetical protein n=1 Tax=Serpentinicella sp. ANB-PHB4 TaxID=3074076 RepID=UPI0028548435|nr:hypothetical protein [Serpentinicella sp. ANB-PHB4]MDR5658887.1 hypothetical protein [Serpentinicella sp. ANB-PHB4]